MFLPSLAVSRKYILGFFLLSLCSFKAHGLGEPSYVDTKNSRGALALVNGKTLATVYVDEADHKGVQRATGDLQLDIERVTGARPRVVNTSDDLGEHAVIIGTIGLSPLIDSLIAEGKVDPSAVKGKWDAFHLEVVNNPLPHVKRALVIVGADRRGTTYGIYDVSEQIGVSPWYYWADVPVAKKNKLFIKKGTRVQEAPVVQYRGIFLNDEAPALSSWVAENHGDYTHEFYVKVFELLLRLKANFLWPAMWNNAFADDDIQNMILADEYGIVMSTSHHEPMMRADKEWNRHGEGVWDYARNPENLYQFWVDGAKRNKDYESIFTMGMRGQEDTPMSEVENIGLLEKIVHDQRDILTKVFTDRDVSEVPQVWCLYKEVQAYYEKGMRVPEDVILLWSDDNAGNIRRLPTAEERKRKGGAGVYYHFDYVGGPRSYRWINVTPLAKVWEQMHLAWKYEATKIWIVNVGDLKPMEFPIDFFLNMAWDPERWGKDNLQEFGRLWAEREFGAQYAQEVESLLTAYTRHNGRRKPELMEPSTYSLLHYDEAARIDAEMDELIERAERLYSKIPDEKKNAFFQLVLHPVKATATVTKMYIAVARNRLYATQGRASANTYAEQAKALFNQDAELKDQYHSINNGKWNGFMNQSHIGYRSWNNPEGDQMPTTYNYEPGGYAELGVAVEGVEGSWPSVNGHALRFDQLGKQIRHIALFNRGTKPFNYQVKTNADWINVSATSGNLTVEEQLAVSIDWSMLPEGESIGSINLKGTSWTSANVSIVARKHPQKLHKNLKGFVEADGYIAIDAENFSKRKSVKGHRWEVVPQHGYSTSSVSVYPVSDEIFEAGKGPVLEYDVSFSSTGEVEVQTLIAPTWPLMPDRQLLFAVSVGDGEPVVVNPLENFKGTTGEWYKIASDGIRTVKSQHRVEKPGKSKIRIYMMEPAVTIQKVIVNTGGLKPSYMGPPQSAKH